MRVILIVGLAMLFCGLPAAAQRTDRSKPGATRSAPSATRTAPARFTERTPGASREAPELTASDTTRSRPEGLEAARSKVPPANRETEANRSSLELKLTSLQGGAAAADEVRALATDLQSMGLQKPDPTLVNDLASSLQNALADSAITPREAAELSQDVYALLNSAGLSPSEVQVLLDDVEAILAAAEVSPSDVAAIVDNLEALAGSAAGAQTPAASRPRPGLRRSSG